MRKTILILLTLVISYSCSSDTKEYDPRDDLSYLNFQNEQLKGIWYFDKVIKTDGTIEDYIHVCPSNKDYTDFQSYKILDFFHWDSQDCGSFYNKTSCQNFIIQGYSMSSCYYPYNGTYTLSGNTLRVDYEEEEFFGQPENNLLWAKGIIFSRN